MTRTGLFIGVDLLSQNKEVAIKLVSSLAYNFWLLVWREEEGKQG
jgi:hypothetical protein